jgi:hypothetical protein
MTFFPVLVEPVNITKSTASTSAEPTPPPPTATCSTFSGSPHSRMPSARSNDVRGVMCEGLRTTALPAASAGIASPNEFVSG